MLFHGNRDAREGVSVNEQLRNIMGGVRMKEAKRNDIEVIIKKMVGKIYSHIKNMKVERSLGNHSLPRQTTSMVVIIDRILDDHRKRKVPPFSYNWIRYN